MSVVAICNQALSWLGENSITSLDDPTNIAKQCKLNFEPVRDAVLEERDWSFAKKRYNLPKNATGPAFRYANAFQLPPDVLRVVSVNDVDFDSATRDWSVEGGNIVTNLSSCKVLAIVRVTDDTLYSPMFTRALACALASDICTSITDNAQLADRLFQRYQFMMGKAANSDGRQGKKKRIRSRWLEQARHSGGLGRTAGPYV